jgi:hypothetical protein
LQPFLRVIDDPLGNIHSVSHPFLKSQLTIKDNDRYLSN